MPVTERQISCAVTLRFEGGGSLTYTKLKLDASDDSAFDFAEAINGMQSRKLRTVTKTRKFELML